MSELRVIVVLELNNIVLGLYTNTQAAYKSMLLRIPSVLQYKVCSYSTVNRAVVNSGDVFDIPTPLGIYTIKKTLLLRKEC